MSSYAIHRRDNQWVITCLRCGRTSYHPQDVQQRYCGACRRFHDEKNIYLRAYINGRWQTAALADLSPDQREQYINELIERRSHHGQNTRPA